MEQTDLAGGSRLWLDSALPDFVLVHRNRHRLPYPVPSVQGFVVSLAY